MKKTLFLLASAALLLSGCNGETSSSSTSGGEDTSTPTSTVVTITSEIWDAQFNEVAKNFTCKEFENGKNTSIFNFNSTGLHRTEFTYNSDGNISSTEEMYLEYDGDTIYEYDQDSTTGKFTKVDATGDNYNFDEYVAYCKYLFTFVGRFSDFSFDETKNGYFASSTTTSDVEVDGEIEKGIAVNDVLVCFNGEKINTITYSMKDDDEIDTFTVEEIGSTTFTFPVVE